MSNKQVGNRNVVECWYMWYLLVVHAVHSHGTVVPSRGTCGTFLWYSDTFSWYCGTLRGTCGTVDIVVHVEARQLDEHKTCTDMLLVCCAVEMKRDIVWA